MNAKADVRLSSKRPTAKADLRDRARLAPRSLASLHPESPLAIANLVVAYGEKPVLSGVDLVTPPGAMMAVVGPNGAGKSTLIKAVLGFIPRLSGVTTSFGQPLSLMRRHIAYVPQRAGVEWDFPATALDVVLMGLYRSIGLFRFAGKSHREKARDCLARMGLQGLEDRQIGQLSGGQQQRVFLARALAEDARIYIMDEPLAGVDAATERVIINLLRELNAAGRTIIAVHHDLTTVSLTFSHVLLLNNRTVAFGTVEDAFTEPNLQAAYGGKLHAAPFLGPVGR